MKHSTKLSIAMLAAAVIPSAAQADARYDFCVREMHGVLPRMIHAQWKFNGPDLGEDAARLLITTHYREDSRDATIAAFDPKVCGNLAVVEENASSLPSGRLRAIVRRLGGPQSTGRIDGGQLLRATTVVIARSTPQTGDAGKVHH